MLRPDEGKLAGRRVLQHRFCGVDVTATEDRELLRTHLVAHAVVRVGDVESAGVRTALASSMLAPSRIRSPR